MRRAFLSHSTEDKAYVEEVAARLTPYRARIDSRAFRPGEDFRDAIRRVMDESGVFVLFVSTKALESSWVNFEIDEAELRTLRRTIRSGLAIFIDGPVDSSVLPEWLARMRAVVHGNPGQSARTIESLLLDASPAAAHPFLGRSDDLQRGIRKLSGAEPRPRILIVSGLEGVGRRTFASHLVRDSLGLDLGPILTLPATGTLEDLFLESQVSSRILTLEEAELEITAFRQLEPAEQAREVAEQLIFLARENAAPCIVDHGGMLNSSGEYFPPFVELLEAYVAERDVYLCLVHTRAPTYRSLRVKWACFERRLKPLAIPDAQALVVRLLRDKQIQAESEEAATLADATTGYPPAAYFIADQVEDYGIDLVLNDSSRMYDFATRSFGRFLRDLKLSAIERELRDDHAAGLARPRRAEQQHRPLRLREPPLPILTSAEPHTATGARGERAERTQGVRASRDRRCPRLAGSSVGGDDRVNHANRQKREDQRDRDAGRAVVDRARDQEHRAHGDELHRRPCDPPAARLGLVRRSPLVWPVHRTHLTIPTGGYSSSSRSIRGRRNRHARPSRLAGSSPRRAR